MSTKRGRTHPAINKTLLLKLVEPRHEADSFACPWSARSVAALSRGLSNIEWRRQGASKELLSKKTTNELVKLMMQVCIMSFHGFACMYERRAVKCEVCGVQ